MIILELLAALVLIAFVHELGHLCMARLFGVVVPQIQIGAGYTLLKGKVGRTVWALGWTLIGGYTRVHGMAKGDAKLRTGGDYRELHPNQQLLIILGGVIANMVLAMAMHGALALANGIHLGGAFIAGFTAPVRILVDAAVKWGTEIGYLDNLAAAHIPQFDGTLLSFVYCTATLSMLIGLLNLLPTKYTDGGRALRLLRGEE